LSPGSGEGQSRSGNGLWRTWERASNQSDELPDLRVHHRCLVALEAHGGIAVSFELDPCGSRWATGSLAHTPLLHRRRSEALQIEGPLAREHEGGGASELVREDRERLALAVARREQREIDGDALLDHAIGRMPR
jgi:hypothetical protein